MRIIWTDLVMQDVSELTENEYVILLFLMKRLMNNIFFFFYVPQS